MPTGVVHTFIGNRIEWATHNDRGIITGKRKDITDEVIGAMFAHMEANYKRDEKSKERGYSGYKIEGVGEIRFIPETKLETKAEEPIKAEE